LEYFGSNNNRSCTHRINVHVDVLNKSGRITEVND
jgi:hypothetical protein